MQWLDPLCSTCVCHQPKGDLARLHTSHSMKLFQRKLVINTTCTQPARSIQRHLQLSVSNTLSVTGRRGGAKMHSAQDELALLLQLCRGISAWQSSDACTNKNTPTVVLPMQVSCVCCPHICCCANLRMLFQAYSICMYAVNHFAEWHYRPSNSIFTTNYHLIDTLKLWFACAAT